MEKIHSKPNGYMYICLLYTSEREDAIELEEDEYFIVDLVGCTVVDTEGFEYGKIKDVIQTPSNDVYWVQGKKEVLVPVLKDIVLDINMDEKLITIRPSGAVSYTHLDVYKRQW